MPKTVRFAKLVAIGEDKMQEVDNLLLAGTAAREVADIIHSWGLLKEMKADSLKKTLERYRGSDLRDKKIAQVAGATKGMSLQTVAKKLNAMDELEKLAVVQKGRFDKILLTESKSDQFLLKQASDEARLYKETLTELAKLQLETGILQRAPKKLTGNFIGNNGELKSFEWTEEQEALLREIEDVEYHEIPRQK